MTRDRLAIEMKILEQFHMGLYSIEILENDDCIIKYDHSNGKSYSIVDLKEYPEKPPQIIVNFIKSPHAVFDLASGEFLIHKNIKEVDGKYCLFIIPENEFNTQWSLFKIIRLVNEWIENNYNLSNCLQ
jgi:hypothetical protein